MIFIIRQSLVVVSLGREDKLLWCSSELQKQRFGSSRLVGSKVQLGKTWNLLLKFFCEGKAAEWDACLIWSDSTEPGDRPDLIARSPNSLVRMMMVVYMLHELRWPLLSFSDPGSSDGAAEPREPCHVSYSRPAGSDGCWSVWLQLPAAHPALHADRSPLQMRRKPKSVILMVDSWIWSQLPGIVSVSFNENIHPIKTQIISTLLIKKICHVNKV